MKMASQQLLVSKGTLKRTITYRCLELQSAFLLTVNMIYLFLYFRDAEIMQQKQKKANEKGDPKAK